jgi:uncharacterized RDD family membrane protein YckC
MNNSSYTPSPAGFWKRYVAYFIDIVMLYIVVEILSLLYFSFQPGSHYETLINIIRQLTANPEATPPDPIAILLELKQVVVPAITFSFIATFVVGVTYFCGMESSKYQGTIGKHILGIKVTDAHGQRIGFLQAFGRYLAAFLSWASLNLGHALAAWTKDRRALHDYVANTRVENVDPSKPGVPIWAWVIIGFHGLLFFGLIAMMVFLYWLLIQMQNAI